MAYDFRDATFQKLFQMERTRKYDSVPAGFKLTHYSGSGGYTMDRRGTLIAVVLFGLLAVTLPALATSYTFETFECSGANPGTTVATGINDSGEVSGYYIGSDGYRHGFVRSAGDVCTEILGPNNATTQVLGINNKGDVVGIYYDASTYTSGGFVRSAADGSSTTIQVWKTSPGQNMNFWVMGINDSGHVTGTLQDNNGGKVHGFIRDADGAITTFDYPSAGQTFASGINNLGEVTGVYLSSDLNHTYCYRRSANGNDFTTISNPDSNAVYTYGINDSGQVAGSLDFLDFIHHAGYYAFVESADGTESSKFYYPDEGDCGHTFGLGINYTGQVVGYISIDNCQGDFSDVGFIATPVTSEPVIDKPASSGITTTTAILGATIESNGGHAITSAGIAYGNSQNPTPSGKKVTTAVINGAFKVTVTGLTSNTLCHFRGYATNSTPATGYTADSTFTTIAAAPKATAATGIGAAKFTANWTTPSGNGAIKGYRIDVAADSAFTVPVTGYKNRRVTGKSTAVRGLKAGKTYYYRVRAMNASGTSNNSKTKKVKLRAQ
jgi:hypothetical protein